MTSIIAALLASTLLTPAQTAEAPPVKFSELAHTYSIVARDPETGELGAAVQTHWFNVGARVIWAEAGVGAVATQSFTDPSYGALGLEMMGAGKTAEQALTALIAGDPGEAVRQVGMIDAEGNVANHTGSSAIVEHCEHAGENYSVQANLMWKATVCDAMVDAFENAEGDLADRMMAALNAAQGEGGDIRGKQSAAILVVEGERGAPSWQAQTYNLRVDDHAEPLIELQRLLTVARAYDLMNEGDQRLEADDVEGALEAYAASQALVPDNHEIIFWPAIAFIERGDFETAEPMFAKAFEMWPLWRELIPRLPQSGLLPDDDELIARIVAIE